MVMVHPFNDPHVIAGQGTIGMEIIKQTNSEIITEGKVSGNGASEPC